MHPAFGRAQDSSGVRLTAFLADEGDGLRPRREKSEVTAFLLSTGSLVLPVVTGSVLAAHSGGTNQAEIGYTVAGAGLLVGPSVGYFYGGCTRRALTGIGIRAGITAVALALGKVTETPGFGVHLLIGGAGLALVTLEGLYECFTVGSCVREHNQTRAAAGVWIAPGSTPGSVNVAFRATF